MRKWRVFVGVLVRKLLPAGITRMLYWFHDIRRTAAEDVMDRTYLVEQLHGQTTRGRFLFVLVATIACTTGVVVAGFGQWGDVQPASHRPRRSVLTRSAPPVISPLPEAPSSAPVDGLIDVGGYNLYLHCIGSGQPTVVLENGLPGTAQVWSLVQPVVAHTTRVCAYDRAGAGRSDPGSRPRTSQTLVHDLHRLLERARVAPPYILVGYSFGGLNVRVFTGQYPRDVVGVVLVDATHEDQQARCLAGLPPESPVEDAGLEAFRTMLTEEWEDAAANPEGVTFAASAAQVGAAGTLGDRPLEVLTASRHGFPHAVAPAAEAAWQAMQLELAQLSSRGSQVILDEVGHCIPCEQPATVIAAIKRVVKAVQQP